MFNIFGQSVSYEKVLFFVLLIGAAIYAGITSRKFKNQEQQFNEAVAKELGWNVYFTAPVNLLYDYFFIYARTSHKTSDPNRYTNSYFFEGFDHSLHFKLLPYYLAAEFFDIKNKNFDYAIISREEYNATYIGVFDKYKKVILESTEFDKNFVVYSLRPDGAFYGLSPDLMAKLIDINQTFLQRLVIEVRENATFIAGGYKPYTEYLASADQTISSKKEALSGFVNEASIILNLLKN